MPGSAGREGGRTAQGSQAKIAQGEVGSFHMNKACNKRAVGKALGARLRRPVPQPPARKDPWRGSCPRSQPSPAVHGETEAHQACRAGWRGGGGRAPGLSPGKALASGVCSGLFRFPREPWPPERLRQCSGAGAGLGSPRLGRVGDGEGQDPCGERGAQGAPQGLQPLGTGRELAAGLGTGGSGGTDAPTGPGRTLARACSFSPSPTAPCLGCASSSSQMEKPRLVGTGLGSHGPAPHQPLEVMGPLEASRESGL